jgi:hypothetical protein
LKHPDFSYRSLPFHVSRGVQYSGLMQIASGLMPDNKQLFSDLQSVIIFEFSIKWCPAIAKCICFVFEQALKYRSVTDIVRPIRRIVRRREETTGHSVRPK